MDKLKSLIPMEEVEIEAQKQIYDALGLPFLEKLAIMPDVHAGYTLPIGGVALLNGVVSPNYVGLDIGCGMCACITDIDAIKTEDKKYFIYDKICRMIPVGFDTREKGIDYPEFKSACGDKDLDKRVAEKLSIQMGTLGGGNHFIEVGATESGKVAVVIHSGSRKSGWLVGNYYMRKSKTVDMHLPNGFLDMDGDLGKAYLDDMNFFLQYALDNRLYMMRVVLEILGVTNKGKKDIINENHNHAVVYGNKVLHRKGATPAEKGQLGIIPANMRDGTYITEGLGNEEYLSSASHGAGRVMSRTKAKESIDVEQFLREMEESDIVSGANESLLDEAPGAYKDINRVIGLQEGIVVKVVDRIKPLVNVKG